MRILNGLVVFGVCGFCLSFGSNLYSADPHIKAWGQSPLTLYAQADPDTSDEITEDTEDEELLGGDESSEEAEDDELLGDESEDPEGSGDEDEDLLGEEDSDDLDEDLDSDEEDEEHDPGIDDMFWAQHLV